MPSLFKVLLKAASAGLFLAGLGFSAAAGEISTGQQAEIEDLIRAYLVKNPEIVRDALIELERREIAEMGRRQSDMIAQSADELLNSPHQIVLGDPAGSTTIVEFFDYNCGYCRRAVNDLLRLLDTDPDLRIVLKELPILGPGSVEAARISIAVNKLAPSKYMEFHLKLMASGGRVDGNTALDVAAQLGLDRATVTAIIDAPGITTALEESASLAQRIGIGGTPAYIVGDELVSGAVGFEVLSEKIAAMRSCGKSVC